MSLKMEEPPKETVREETVRAVSLSPEMLGEIEAQSGILSGTIYPENQAQITEFLTTVKSNFQAISDKPISPEEKESLRKELKGKLPAIQKELITNKLSKEENDFVQSLLDDIIASSAEAKPIGDYEML